MREECASERGCLVSARKDWESKTVGTNFSMTRRSSMRAQRAALCGSSSGLRIGKGETMKGPYPLCEQLSAFLT